MPPRRPRRSLRPGAVPGEAMVNLEDDEEGAVTAEGPIPIQAGGSARLVGTQQSAADPDAVMSEPDPPDIRDPQRVSLIHFWSTAIIGPTLIILTAHGQVMNIGLIWQRVEPGAGTSLGPTRLDRVFLRSLSLTAVIGKDAWHRPGKAQPVLVDISIQTPVLQAAAHDRVEGTVHYGELCRSIAARLADCEIFRDLKHFVSTVFEAAFAFLVDSHAIEIRVTLPKGSLLAEGIGLKTEISLSDTCRDSLTRHASFFVDKMRIFCIIGVNPHERLDKQQIILGMQFFGLADDFLEQSPSLLRRIHQFIQTSDFQTLEALATQVARIPCEARLVSRVTVSIEKPSALPFVAGAGIEITRTTAELEDGL